MNENELIKKYRNYLYSLLLLEEDAGMYYHASQIRNEIENLEAKLKENSEGVGNSAWESTWLKTMVSGVQISLNPSKTKTKCL